MTHEFNGYAPSRAGRKLSKLGPGIIELDKLDELLREHDTEAWFRALGKRAGPEAEARARAKREQALVGGARGGENNRP